MRAVRPLAVEVPLVPPVLEMDTAFSEQVQEQPSHLVRLFRTRHGTGDDDRLGQKFHALVDVDHGRGLGQFGRLPFAHVLDTADD